MTRQAGWLSGVCAVTTRLRQTDMTGVLGGSCRGGETSFSLLRYPQHRKTVPERTLGNFFTPIIFFSSARRQRRRPRFCERCRGWLEPQSLFQTLRTSAGQIVACERNTGETVAVRSNVRVRPAVTSVFLHCTTIAKKTSARGKTQLLSTSGRTT